MAVSGGLPSIIPFPHTSPSWNPSREVRASAGYSLHYPFHRVKLYDVDEIVCAVWDYLINVSPEEIRRLPVNVVHLDDHNLFHEQKWLIGYWMHKASDRPTKTPLGWMLKYPRASTYWGETIRERIAQQVQAIRHWTIEQMRYENIPDMEATWFVDSPYNNRAGESYTHGPRGINYGHLGDWCRSRRGQVIVCENQGATWLKFAPLGTFWGQRKQSHEVIWINDEGHLNRHPENEPTLVCLDQCRIEAPTPVDHLVINDVLLPQIAQDSAGGIWSRAYLHFPAFG